MSPTNYSIADRNNLAALDGEDAEEEVIETAKAIYLTVAERDTSVSRIRAWHVAHCWIKVGVFLKAVLPDHIARVSAQVREMGNDPLPDTQEALMAFFRGRLINMSFPNSGASA